ncbi:hypothetical protein MC885_008491 [Smutsia gigantea]|nr:hypothetical protein MC885_008491 [Smutsia gigantea]
MPCPDDIPACLIERMTALWVQAEVSEMHRLSPVLWGHSAAPGIRCAGSPSSPAEDKARRGDGLRDLCKGLIVYEVKSNSRIATLRFQWREIGKISTCRKKFTITSSTTGKKHAFVTNSANTCGYLLRLCSARHGFNARVRSPRAVTDHAKCVPMANMSLVQSKPLSWIQRLSYLENALFTPRLEDTAGSLLHLSLDNFNVETGTEGTRGRWV